MNKNFWNGKKVLITGHTGFKGGWLSVWLHKLGATVTGYSLEPPSQPCFFDVANVEECVEHNHGDIRDPDNFQKVLNKCKPDVIFHLAAQPIVRLSYKDPTETYSTNVIGTLNILEGIRKSNSVQVAIIVTTDKCYENKEQFTGYKEDDPVGGFDLYSSSKGCVEILISSYRRSFFQSEQTKGHDIHLATVRAGNVIGGGDWGEDRLIPDIIRSYINNHAITIRYPDAVRPWQHVLEPLSGYLLLAEKMWHDQTGIFSSAWNFGPEEIDEKTVSHVIKRLVALWGKELDWSVSLTDNLHEAGLLKLDCSKARTQLNWSPRWNLDIALENTVEWYRDYEQENNLFEKTINQISSYENTGEAAKVIKNFN